MKKCRRNEKEMDRERIQYWKQLRGDEWIIKLSHFSILYHYLRVSVADKCRSTYGNAMAQAVSRCHRNAQFHADSQGNLYMICNGQSGTLTVSSPITFNIPLSVSFH
jgi:hypothetical protein